MEFLKLYLIAFVVFIIIDGLWLGIISKKLYKKELGHLMSTSVNYIAAVVFYLLFIVGLVYFVILPGITDKNVGEIIISGLLFGLISYSTYDLTNLATLKSWPLKITIIDLIWGSFLSTSVSLVTYFLYNLV